MLIYLLINWLVFLFTVIFAFERRVKFYTKWPRWFLSTLLIAIPLIIWDVIFTRNGVWGFSEEYLTGIQFINIPIEEVLFFFTIPYASMFTYEIFKFYYKRKHENNFLKVTYLFLGIVLIATAFMFREKDYTFVTFLIAGLISIVAVVIETPKLSQFTAMFFFALIPFFIINSILTGGLSGISDNPIVWYNDGENLSIRIGTIPVEDIFYMLILLMGNYIIYEKLNHARQKDKIGN